MEDDELPPSSPSMYYFIRESKSWHGAQNYCMSEYTSPAQIQHQDNITALMNTPKTPYTGKAWIGLHGRASSEQWVLMDEQPATYFNWSSDQPDNYNGNKLCVVMNSDGGWHNQKCSEKKTNCEKLDSTLVEILDKKTNSEIRKLLPQGSTMWIGLKNPILWYWATSNGIATFTNWQNNGNESCVQIRTGGLWSDKNCEILQPSVCYNGKKRF
uniref:C-type lectin domain-containing protein n=1 Tax=Acanthochromis polyacanthus TaxID=80966 RepID=A0A3Q1GGP5_9TELE